MPCASTSVSTTTRPRSCATGTSPRRTSSKRGRTRAPSTARPRSSSRSSRRSTTARAPRIPRRLHRRAPTARATTSSASSGARRSAAAPPRRCAPARVSSPRPPADRPPRRRRRRRASGRSPPGTSAAQSHHQGAQTQPRLPLQRHPAAARRDGFDAPRRGRGDCHGRRRRPFERAWRKALHDGVVPGTAARERGGSAGAGSALSQPAQGATPAGRAERGGDQLPGRPAGGGRRTADARASTRSSSAPTRPSTTGASPTTAGCRSCRSL